MMAMAARPGAVESAKMVVLVPVLVVVEVEIVSVQLPVFDEVEIHLLGRCNRVPLFRDVDGRIEQQAFSKVSLFHIGKTADAWAECKGVSRRRSHT
jgi:hypothetical protein